LRTSRRCQEQPVQPNAPQRLRARPALQCRRIPFVVLAPPTDGDGRCKTSALDHGWAKLLRQSCALAVGAWIVSAAAVADETNLPAATRPPPPASGPTNLWFPVGEGLVYRTYWGVIPVGKARIQSAWLQAGTQTLFSVRYRARSNRVLALIYPIDDRAELLVDPISFLPLRYTVNMSEGRHRSLEVTTFDHQALVGTWESVWSKKKKTFPLESDTRDIVTFLYHARQRQLAAGEKSKYRVMADDKIYDLWLEALKEETLRLPGFGKVSSLKIKPTAAFNGLFVRKGEMRVWISTDPRRILLKLEADLPFANIRAVLSEVHGPGEDFWTTTTKRLIDSGDIEKDDAEVEKSLRELDLLAAPDDHDAEKK
jgi:hypothetical protein